MGPMNNEMAVCKLLLFTLNTYIIICKFCTYFFCKMSFHMLFVWLLVATLMLNVFKRKVSVKSMCERMDFSGECSEILVSNQIYKVFEK